MKLLLVLWGESFRSGPQLSRIRGTENYIERQLFASKSHIDLINKLKEKNFEIDVFIDTYKLNIRDDSLLIDFYKINNVNITKTVFHNNVFPSEVNFLNDMYDNVNSLLKMDNYDFILLSRIDLYLKDYFIKNIDLQHTLIKFAHIDGQCNINDVNNKIYVPVSHLIMLYPKWAFYVFQNQIVYNSTHNILKNLTISGIDYNNIDFFVNSLHACSTDLEWNPIYVQIGRHYTLKCYLDIWGTSHYVYDINQKVLIKDINNGIIIWNNHIETYEKETNDKIFSITSNIYPLNANYKYFLYNFSKNETYNLEIHEIINIIKNNSNDEFYKIGICGKLIKINNEIAINTQFICHRINTIEELKKIPTMFGVELDIRDSIDTQSLILSHDPYSKGEDFEIYLKNYNHNTLILNIKSERTEIKCLEFMEKYNISNYFFLDSNMPMINHLNKTFGNNQIACRFSEYEPIESYQKIKDMVSWIWVDCFTEQPLTKSILDIFRKDGKKICIVSPELQNQFEKISDYRDKFLKESIVPDAICCKLDKIIEWL